AVGLSDDVVGAGYNHARQILLSRGVELVELHHTVKRSSGTVADVFGSVWLSSGTGSIIMLTGQPGDPIVGFRHVKQPAQEIGPLTLSHDESTGTISILSSTDPVALAKEAGDEGITARALAAVMFDNSKPTKGEIEKARRQLNTLTGEGSLRCIPGTTGGSTGGAATRWVSA
ncbi:MAG: AAA family ATPase, partial [Mycobacterium sp.]